MVRPIGQRRSGEQRLTAQAGSPERFWAATRPAAATRRAVFILIQEFGAFERAIDDAVFYMRFLIRWCLVIVDGCLIKGVNKWATAQKT